MLADYAPRPFGFANEELLTDVLSAEINAVTQHLAKKICRREPVRAIKLARCLKALEEYESAIQSKPRPA